MTRTVGGNGGGGGGRGALVGGVGGVGGSGGADANGNDNRNDDATNKLGPGTAHNLVCEFIVEACGAGMDVEITGIDRPGIDKYETQLLAQLLTSAAAGRRGGGAVLAINDDVVHYDGDDISSDRKNN
jgi:hypothetical protein